jgi:light-regulated signal transduction histidine kinase (bacteriophytochrome)
MNNPMRLLTYKDDYNHFCKMSLRYDIVKANSGEIKVETKEGEGSIFRISIPCL